jgi:hypothetical protein
LPTEPSAHACFVRRGSYPYRNLAGILLLSFLLSPGVMRAEKGGEQEANPSRSVEPGRREGGAFQLRRPLAGGVFRRLRELSPAEQRRVMANNPVFRSFSPERQELIRERLRQWNAMTPQEKERVRQREEIFESLSPLQRREARNIFPQWRDLPPARRQALMVAFRHLRDIPPDQRQTYLNSQPVREQFSPHERDILEGLNRLLPESHAVAQDDPDQ